MAQHLLVVDDDHDLAEMLGIVLEGEGFITSHAADGQEALDRFRDRHFDLVLLDVMLPGLSGIEVCQKLREESGVPIIMLTARTDTNDVVAGLEAGADDYVVKPFNPVELLARVRARLREVTPDVTETLQLGDLEIHVAAHDVRRGGQPVQLTPLEFDLLVTLARHPDQAFSREELLERVWGYHYKADTRLVNVHVQRLRAKIEKDPENPKLVVTVRGLGYRAGQTAT